MLSRTCVADVPSSTLFNVVAISSELTPSCRALSCKTSTLTTRSDLKQFHVSVCSRKHRPQIGFKLRLELFPRRDTALRHDHPSGQTRYSRSANRTTR